MNSTTFIRRSILYYWRTHAGVVLGAALATMVLTGALLVGDSVKATLRHLALLRVGRVEAALFSFDRNVRDELAIDLEKTTGATVAPALFLRGSLSSPETSQRLNAVQVLGVDDRFWRLSPGGQVSAPLPDGEVWINQRVAGQINIEPGATVVVRVEKTSSVSRDAPLSGSEDDLVALRAKVTRIVTDDEFGRFALQGSQVPPFTVFFPLRFLQQRLDLGPRANLLLASGPREPATGSKIANWPAALASAWKLADAELEVRPLAELEMAELRSRRVFIEATVATAAQSISNQNSGVLTYFVNEVRHGERATPYSMISAVDASASGFFPEELRADEIAINQWLADDLGAKEGDTIAIKYYVVGLRRAFEERTAEFRVRTILAMAGAAIDPGWMPDFPGLSDAENCRDWKPGIPMDLTRMRDKDEQYWDQYRGAPKAFIALATGQKLWSNRWGNLTAVRYPTKALTPELIETKVRQQVDPATLGLSFQPLREEALESARSPVDFGQLFLAFSFFLIVAAAVLTGLLFVFSVEQRSHEAGLLLAVGLQPRKVRSLLLLEGLALSVFGTALGLAAAWLYTRSVLHALSTIWKGAVGTVTFSFAAQPTTVIVGAILGLGIAMIAIWFTSRRQALSSARALLASESGAMAATSQSSGRMRVWKVLSLLATIAGAALLCWPASSGNSASPATFFLSGMLLLIGGVGGCYLWLCHVAQSSGGVPDLLRLGFRNAGRQRGRSLAIAAILAAGVFIVVAVTAFQHPPGKDSFVRGSGTGGFALVGEMAVPVYQNLNASDGREAFGLANESFRDVAFVPMRIKDGDDASCLNLNRAVQPRLLGVLPSELKQRQSFSFSAVAKGLASAEGWALLEEPEPDGAVRAITDEATLKWALGKKIGDSIDYTDDAGKVFPVRIVAAVSPSILQGNLLISENSFMEKFPGQAGYRWFLIDAPAQRVDALIPELSRAFADQGLELTPAWQRLADFQAVENTYLSIFQVLGGLGLILGSAAVGVVIARNVIERRREFGLLQAVGFRRPTLRRLVYLEHQWLIFWGLAVGIVAAVAAVWPSLRHGPAGFPWTTMGLLIGGIVVGYLLCAAFAVALGLRASNVASLRTE